MSRIDNDDGIAHRTAGECYRVRGYVTIKAYVDFTTTNEPEDIDDEIRIEVMDMIDDERCCEWDTEDVSIEIEEKEWEDWP